MTEGFKRLAKMLDFEAANYPIKMSDKGRLMELSDEAFEVELDRMAREYHKERYEG